MPRQSSIKSLPPDILEKLQELLRDPRVSQLETTRQINAILEERGEARRVTKSSVNRYHLTMEEAGRHLRESREVAEMWINKLGTAPESKVGQLTSEFVRTLSFDLTLLMRKMMNGQELSMEDMPEAIKMIKNLAITQHRLESAQMQSVRREEEIRKKAAAEAADAAEEMVSTMGLTHDQAKELREKMLLAVA